MDKIVKYILEFIFLILKISKINIGKCFLNTSFSLYTLREKDMEERGVVDVIDR